MAGTVGAAARKLTAVSPGRRATPQGSRSLRHISCLPNLLSAVPFTARKERSATNAKTDEASVRRRRSRREDMSRALR